MNVAFFFDGCYASLKQILSKSICRRKLNGILAAKAGGPVGDDLEVTLLIEGVKTN